MREGSASLGLLRRYPLYCWFFVLGYVLAPMTEWRVWKVGPAEVLCLLGCLEYLRQECIRVGGLSRLSFKLTFISEFWVAFIFLAAIGSVWCLYAFPREAGALGLTTWVYFAIVSTVAYDALSQLEDIERVLVLAVSISVIWYSLMYLYGELVSIRFFGANLWYGGKARFTGGAGNPHQLALPMAIGAVVLVVNALTHRSLSKKAMSLVLAILAVWLLLETESSTGKMALVAGLAMVFLSRMKDGRLRLAIIFCLIALCLVFIHPLYDAFMSWVSSDKNGMGRFEIFSTYPIAFEKSPIVGLGPGAHALNGIQEFHNTYLEVLAMCGLLGGFIFTFFSFEVYEHIRNSPVSVAIFFSLYAFGFAGFAMRRLVYWMALAFAMAISDHNKGRSTQGGTLLATHVSTMNRVPPA